MAVGLKTPGARRIIYDTSNGNAVYVVSSVDSIEWQTRDSRYVETLPAGQVAGTQTTIVFPWVGLS
jgi:hypothetical protein